MLLIIFMVGSSIVVEQAQGGGTGVRVDLPKGAAKELQAQARDFPVAVLKDGTVVAEGKAIDLGALKDRFEKLLHDAPDAQVSQEHLPDTLRGRVYYQPTDRGAEKEIADRLAKWRAWRARQARG